MSIQEKECSIIFQRLFSPGDSLSRFRFVFDSDKKPNHASGKSSKNKKSKQKGKGKADSTEKESWRQETVSNPEQSAVHVKPATEIPSDHSSETESAALIQSAEESDTVTNQEEQIVRTQDATTENAVVVEEPKEGNEQDSGMELKADVTSENEAILIDRRRASEKAKPDVVFRQEAVMPLRSRGELRILQSYVCKLAKCSKMSQNLLVCLCKSWKFKTSDWDKALLTNIFTYMYIQGLFKYNNYYYCYD